MLITPADRARPVNAPHAREAPLIPKIAIVGRPNVGKSTLFNWLVERMNVTILPEGEGTEQFKRETKTIGLLDIFGFENF